MGTKMAPTYDTLTLSHLEENLYVIIGKKIRQRHKRRIYQIIEKIFGWLLHILEIPMGRHLRITQSTTKVTQKIKFTMEHSSEELPLLHILIKNVNGQIITDIYHNQQTPNNGSFKSHPTNCIKSIPYTLARRIYTITTDKNLKKLTLKNYTYPKP